MFKCTNHSKPRFSRDTISTGVTEIGAGSFYLLMRYKIIQWNFMSSLVNGSLSKTTRFPKTSRAIIET